MNPPVNAPSPSEAPSTGVENNMSFAASYSTEQAPTSQSSSPERLAKTDSAHQGPQTQAAGVQLPAVQPSAQVSPQKPASGPPSTSTPAIADDVDVIEKEWVDKAKDIVTATKDDPYRQEEEVERLKADYLKKRYGKDIKSSPSA